MNVAGPALYGIGEHQVHQLDYRSFVGRFLQLRQLHLLLFRLHFDVALVHLRHRLHDGFEIFFRLAAVRFVNTRQDGALGGYNWLDVEAGHELDIVHGEDVGGIHHGDGERCAHAA